MIEKISKLDFTQTLSLIEERLNQNGQHIFYRIDHQAGATNAGLTLEPTLVLGFGNPKVGTFLITDQRAIALDLPLRILITKEDATVKIRHLNPKTFTNTYQLAASNTVALEKMSALYDKLTAPPLT